MAYGETHDKQDRIIELLERIAERLDDIWVIMPGPESRPDPEPTSKSFTVAIHEEAKRD